jgi:hypothetical protein
MGCGKQMEAMSFRKALRLGRRQIRVWLQGDKKPSRVWSSYHLARGVEAPVQRMPKVGHFSIPKAERW